MSFNLDRGSWQLDIVKAWESRKQAWYLNDPTKPVRRSRLTNNQR
jgi:hypothetical protein